MEGSASGNEVPLRPPKQQRVGVGVVPLGAGIKQRGVLDAYLHQLFGLPDSLVVGEKLVLPLLVLRIAGDTAGHIRHLAQRDLIPVGDAIDILLDRVV